MNNGVFCCSEAFSVYGSGGRSEIDVQCRTRGDCGWRLDDDGWFADLSS